MGLADLPIVVKKIRSPRLSQVSATASLATSGGLYQKVVFRCFSKIQALFGQNKARYARLFGRLIWLKFPVAV